jgi:hypothetical protein
MVDYAGSEKAFSPAIFGSDGYERDMAYFGGAEVALVPPIFSSDGYRREVGPYQPGALRTLGDVVVPALPDIREEPNLPRVAP